MAKSKPGGPPPLWPDRRHVVVVPPAWNQPTQPLRLQQRPSPQWWPYVVFGGTVLLVGFFAVIMVVLAR